MKLLFINACPRGNSSRTLTLAQKYKDIFFSEYQLDEIDITNGSIQILDNNTLTKRNNLILQNKLNDKIFIHANHFASADKIIIAAPYWDLSFPSCLKNYIEQICVCSITFKYDSNGIPLGLCKASELIYITTAGGYIGEYNLGFDYIKSLCKLYYKIPVVKFIVAEGLDITGNNPKEILKKTENSFK